MFASAIVALPVAAWRGAFHVAFGLIGLISVELVILATNRGRCPLTAVAARHTTERQPNFDIYLPVWLARWNKVIFARFSSVDCCSQGFSGCRGPARNARSIGSGRGRLPLDGSVQATCRGVMCSRPRHGDDTHRAHRDESAKGIDERGRVESERAAPFPSAAVRSANERT